MSIPIIPVALSQADANKRRKRQTPKGRHVDAGALEEVQRLLGPDSRQRDLLIENLHKIQDSFGHLSAAHLAALAQEMHLAQTEVFEVASFYHHFDIVKEGETPPAALTVRVCDGLSCELAGAADLLARLPVLLDQAIIAFGDDAQKAQHVPAIVTGEVRWCQGYSEPGAGSDLASLRTRAVLDGD